MGTLGGTCASRGARQNALSIDVPLQYHVRRRIELPAGASIGPRPVDLDISDANVHARRKLKMAGNVVEEDFVLSLPTGTVSAARYQAFVEKVAGHRRRVRGRHAHQGRVMSIQAGVPLAPLTTLGVGGPARHFVEASTEADVARSARLGRRSGPRHAGAGRRIEPPRGRSRLRWSGVAPAPCRGIEVEHARWPRRGRGRRRRAVG